MKLLATARRWRRRVFDGLVPLVAAKLKGEPMLLEAKELRAIAACLADRGPCRFLIFGLGHDSALWARVNAGGRTVFLEDQASWRAKVAAAHPALETHLVTYATRLGQWEALLESPRQLAMTLPETVAAERWDVVLVDGPRGDLESFRAEHGIDPPGRMCSLFEASRLGAPGGDVFVHDCERPVERAYAARYLGEHNRVGDVRGRALLAHYRLPEASQSLAEKGSAVAACVLCLHSRHLRTVDGLSRGREPAVLGNHPRRRQVPRANARGSSPREIGDRPFRRGSS